MQRLFSRPAWQNRGSVWVRPESVPCFRQSRPKAPPRPETALPRLVSPTSPVRWPPTRNSPVLLQAATIWVSDQHIFRRVATIGA
jgi:hypothetical protein